MSMDVSYQDTPSSRFYSKVIQLGANFFIKDVENTTFSERLNITVFNFKSLGEIGSAEVLKNKGTNPYKKNGLFKAYSVDDFDCLKSDGYDTFFNEEITKVFEEKKNQKFIVIFLAHSFGAGFFFKQKDPPPIAAAEDVNNGERKIEKKDPEFEYFSTVQLNQSLKNALKGKKIDCFIGLNCWLQSIETNVLFSNTANYLISSQQPLETTELSYSRFFMDLVYTAELQNGDKVPLSDEIIFSKFLYNCYHVYRTRLDQETRPIFKLDSFGISLTKPPLAKKYKEAINIFWNEMYLDTKHVEKPLGNRNVDYWSYAAHFCSDPSYIQSVNIIDATQFFLKLKTFYPDGSKMGKAIEAVLDTLRKVVVLNVSSPYMCSTNMDSYNLLTTYVPYGVGIFTPKLLSVNLHEILKIYEGTEAAHGVNLTVNDKNAATNDIPKPREDFYENMLDLIAEFHNGKTLYEDRNTKMYERLFTIGDKDMTK